MFTSFKLFKLLQILILFIYFFQKNKLKKMTLLFKEREEQYKRQINEYEQHINELKKNMENNTSFDPKRSLMDFSGLNSTEEAGEIIRYLLNLLMKINDVIKKKL